MSLHVHCPTDVAVLLLAIHCPDGILRFPYDGLGWPGLNVKVEPILGINVQLLQRAEEAIGSDLTKKLSIWQEYSSVMQLGGRDAATLYVGVIRPTAEALDQHPWSTWSSLPALIRSLPKDRNRLAYLKAWQVLTGGLEESTKALDVDEVSRYLKSIEADNRDKS